MRYRVGGITGLIRPLSRQDTEAIEELDGTTGGAGKLEPAIVKATGFKDDGRSAVEQRAIPEATVAEVLSIRRHHLAVEIMFGDKQQQSRCGAP
jgi:hypothetical protein